MPPLAVPPPAEPPFVVPPPLKVCQRIRHLEQQDHHSRRPVFLFQILQVSMYIRRTAFRRLFYGCNVIIDFCGVCSSNTMAYAADIDISTFITVSVGTLSLSNTAVVVSAQPLPGLRPLYLQTVTETMLSGFSNLYSGAL